VYREIGRAVQVYIGHALATLAALAEPFDHHAAPGLVKIKA
jgi:hypothetical protein